MVYCISLYSNSREHTCVRDTDAEELGPTKPPEDQKTCKGSHIEFGNLKFNVGRGMGQSERDQWNEPRSLFR